MRLTVGIPTYNEARSIGRLLEQICTDPIEPHVLEEVIVCDESTDETPAIVAAAAQRHPAIRLIRKTGRTGIGTAMNAMFAEAKGDAIVRLDADLSLTPGSLRSLAEALERGAALAFGACDPIYAKKNFVSLGSAFGSRVLQELQTGAHGVNFVTGRIFAVRTGDVRSLRIPPDIINEDSYLQLWLRNTGATVRFVPSARCAFRPPTTFSDYWRQSRRMLEGGRQLRRTFKFEEAPLGEVLSAVARCLPRAPLAAVCWCVMYALSSLRSAPATTAPWPIATTTKGPVGQ